MSKLGDLGIPGRVCSAWRSILRMGKAEVIYMHACLEQDIDMKHKIQQPMDYNHVIPTKY